MLFYGEDSVENTREYLMEQLYAFSETSRPKIEEDIEEFLEDYELNRKYHRIWYGRTQFMNCNESIDERIADMKRSAFVFWTIIWCLLILSVVILFAAYFDTHYYTKRTREYSLMDVFR
jgi:hypothetical protein